MRSLQKRVEVGVDVLVDRRPAAAVVDHARRGDRQLRRRGRHARLQEPEVVGEDRLLERDRRVDVQRGRRELERALGVAELDLHRSSCARVTPPSAVDEVHVPRGAAELAVGGRAQPDLLLLAHDVADRLVLDRRAARRRRCGPGLEVLAGLQQPRRAQQAADVVGAEGGPGACGHGSLLALSRCATAFLPRRAAQGVAVSAPSPAAWRRASALSVGSHVKSWSSRPKCPYAAVFW